MIDISILDTGELDALSKEIEKRQYELEDKSFDEFFKSKDFELLCRLDKLTRQQQDIEITITVSALVSIASNKDETRIDIVAKDKYNLVRDSKMKEALSQNAEVQRMQITALKAQAMYDEKWHEFMDKYELDRATAICKVINKMNRVKWI